MGARGGVKYGVKGTRPLVGCGAKPRIAEQSSAAAQTNSANQEKQTSSQRKRPRKPPTVNSDQYYKTNQGELTKTGLYVGG